MIRDRPAFLLADPAYKTFPTSPLEVDWTSIPELLRISMLDLGGIQPITVAMAEVAGGTLRDKPSEGEIKLFQDRGTAFQLVSVVLSCVAAGEKAGKLQVRPFAVTLIPASKRGDVDERSIDAIAHLDISHWLASEVIYSGYDPFSGDWALFGNMSGYIERKRDGFLDEIGIVVDQYFLATTTPRDDEILTMDLRMPSGEMRERYERHRRKLLFTPFKKVEARRVWGAETPIELFLIQALAREGLYPECQMLFTEDGIMVPSWYHLWQDIEFRHTTRLITQADLFFPAQKVAVFCDGAHHARTKQKAKDAAITEKLKAFGVQSVRIPGADIKFDLGKAVKAVKDALA